MHLNFSVEFLLGTRGKRENSEKDTGENTSDVDLSKKDDADEKSNSPTLTQKAEGSPRNFTIEWKPHHRDYIPPPLAKEYQRRMSNRELESHNTDITVSRSASNLHHPPVLFLPPFCGSRFFENDSFYAKMNGLSLLDERISAPQYQPFCIRGSQSPAFNDFRPNYPHIFPFTRHPVYGTSSTSLLSLLPQRKAPPDASQSLKDKEVTKGARKDISSPKTEQKENTLTTIRKNSGQIKELELPREMGKMEKPESQDRVDSSSAKEQKKVSKRKGRRLFTGLQILELEKAFAIKPYLSRMERAYISQKVNLSESQIKTWFQNRRTKEKRAGNGSEEDEANDPRSGFPNVASKKPVHIPGYGIQFQPSYGPPDHHLQAAIVDYFRRRASSDYGVKNM